LSNHEVRILRRLADGRSTDEIAADLTISVATVRTHLRNIFTKMNVHQRSDAINVARTAGLLDAA
jgi:LuxR family maltose regulon positive regulatory protein